MPPSWHATQPNLIGGGVVRRSFLLGDRRVTAGTPLARDQILAMPVANRKALIENGFIEVYPMRAGERFISPAAKGLYHVVEGQRITTEPLPRDQAEQLASGKSAA